MKFGVRTYEGDPPSWTTIETDDLNAFLNNAAACHRMGKQRRGEGKPLSYEVRNEERISVSVNGQSLTLGPGGWRRPGKHGMLAILWSAKKRGVR